MTFALDFKVGVLTGLQHLNEVEDLRSHGQRWEGWYKRAVHA